MGTIESLEGSCSDSTESYSNRYDKNIKIPKVTCLKKIICGNDFTYAFANDGNILTWGSNVQGELGIGGGFKYFKEPLIFSDTNKIKKIACGFKYSAAVAHDGSLLMWGFDYNIRLFTHTNENTKASNLCSSIPLLIAKGSKFSNITCGPDRFFAIAVNGKTYAYGEDRFGQLGTGNCSVDKRLVRVKTDVKFKKIRCTHDCTLGYAENGNMYAWGLNTDGALGLDRAIRSVNIPTLTNCFKQCAIYTWREMGEFKKIIAGNFEYTAAIDEEDECYYWNKCTNLYPSKLHYKAKNMIAGSGMIFIINMDNSISTWNKKNGFEKTQFTFWANKKSVFKNKLLLSSTISYDTEIIFL